MKLFVIARWQGILYRHLCRFLFPEFLYVRFPQQLLQASPLADVGISWLERFGSSRMSKAFQVVSLPVASLHSKGAPCLRKPSHEHTPLWLCFGPALPPWARGRLHEERAVGHQLWPSHRARLPSANTHESFVFRVGQGW